MDMQTVIDDYRKSLRDLRCACNALKKIMPLCNDESKSRFNSAINLLCAVQNEKRHNALNLIVNAPEQTAAKIEALLHAIR